MNSLLLLTIINFSSLKVMPTNCQCSCQDLAWTFEVKDKAVSPQAKVIKIWL